MTSLHIATVDLNREPKTPERGWLEHLQSLISADWRPDEFDHQALRLTPKISPHTVVSLCQKTGCGVLLESGRLCPGCNTAWSHARRTGAVWGEWLAQPRQKRYIRTACDVAECPRTHRGLGLCVTHLAAFKKSERLRGADLSTAIWIAQTTPQPARPAAKCRAPDCLLDCNHKNGLCQLHYQRYRAWSRRGGHAELGTSVDVWFDLECEPLLSKDPPTTFASLAATPFILLPEPLRWEFLYAVQQRDLSGRTKLSPVQIRGTYLALRRSGVSSVVGANNLGIETTNPTRRGKLVEWQRLIDDAHRDWSGVDRRDPNLLYLRDLTLKRSSTNIGPKASIDLGQITQDWIVEAIRAWAKAAPRGHYEVYGIANTWAIVSRVLDARATPVSALGAHDVDAIMKEFRSRWSIDNTQKRAIGHMRKLIAFARAEQESVPSWEKVSARFSIDSTRHVAVGVSPRSARDTDEPFRFVPQPIVDWLMDHLDILRRRNPYLTAEARALLFVHERSAQN